MDRGRWGRSSGHDPLRRGVLPGGIGVGSLRIPVAFFAWGVSGMVHGGLLGATFLVTWSPALVSKPKINFARGERVFSVKVTLVRSPDAVVNDPVSVDPPVPPSPESSVAPEPPMPDPVPNESDVPEPVADGPEKAPPVEVENRVPPPEPADKSEKGDKDEKKRASLPEPLEPVGPPWPDPDADVQVRLLPPIPEHIIPEPPPKQPDTPPEKQEPEHRRPKLPNPPKRRTVTARPGVKTGVKILDLPHPKYPSVSRRRGEEGLVLLQVEVLPDGSVGEIKVLQSPHYPRLVEAATAAARKARFAAATMNGHPVRAVVRIPFRFVLQ